MCTCAEGRYRDRNGIIVKVMAPHDCQYIRDRNMAVDAAIVVLFGRNRKKGLTLEEWLMVQDHMKKGGKEAEINKSDVGDVVYFSKESPPDQYKEEE